MNPPQWDETAEDDKQEDSRQEPESTYASSRDFASLVPIIRKIRPTPPKDDQAGPSTAVPKSAAPTGQRRRNSRPMESHSLQLEIVEPEQNEPERPPRDPEDEALYQALHGECYDPYA